MPVESTAWDEGLETVVLTSLECALASAPSEPCDENLVQPVTETAEVPVSPTEFKEETSQADLTPPEAQPAVLPHESTPPPLLIAMAESLALSRNVETLAKPATTGQESPAVEQSPGPAGLLNALSQSSTLPEEHRHPPDQPPFPNLQQHLPRELHSAKDSSEPVLTTTSGQSAGAVPESADPQPLENRDRADSSADHPHRTAQPTRSSLLEIPAPLVGVSAPQQPPTPSTTVTARPASSVDDQSPQAVSPVVAPTPAGNTVFTTTPGAALETKSGNTLPTTPQAPLAEDATTTLLSKVLPGAKSAESSPEPTAPPPKVTTQPDRPAAFPTPGPSTEELFSGEETRSRDEAGRLPATPPLKHTPAEQLPQPASPTVVPTHDARQLVDRLTEVVLMARDQGPQLAVQLSPPELGPLRVEVHVHQGAVLARLETLTEAARQVLTEHLPKLQEALSQRGTPLERIEVVRREDSETTGGFSHPHWSAAEQQSGREEHASPRRRWTEPLTARRRAAEVAPSPVLDAGLQELNIRI